MRQHWQADTSTGQLSVERSAVQLAETGRDKVLRKPILPCVPCNWDELPHWSSSTSSFGDSSHSYLLLFLICFETLYQSQVDSQAKYWCCLYFQHFLGIISQQSWHNQHQWGCLSRSRALSLPTSFYVPEAYGQDNMSYLRAAELSSLSVHTLSFS